MIKRMFRLRFGGSRLAAALFLCLAWPFVHAAEGDSIRFEVPVLPALQKYADLLLVPGVLAVALENNGLSPSMSSKLQIHEGGRALEIRNAKLRFVSRREAIFTYEASVTLDLGVSESRLSFPLAIDLSQVAAGKALVTLSPPMARLFPNELVDRIRIKTHLIANASAQQKVLDYLARLSKERPVGAAASMLIEPILVDAYNKGGTVGHAGGRDVGDAIPLSDQWLLLLTLLVWVVLVPGFLLIQRIRAVRAKSG